MSTKELREKAHKVVDEVPDERLLHFIAILTEVRKVPGDRLSHVVTIMEEIQKMMKEVEFEARVKRIIDTNRGLLQRLAQ